MKKPLLIGIAVALFGVGIAAWADGDVVKRYDPAVATEMGYRTMANGSIVYEEVAPTEDANAGVPIEDIAPAAGKDDHDEASDIIEAPRFKYDPVTQTYRRVVVDKRGNAAQDVISNEKHQ